MYIAIILITECNCLHQIFTVLRFIIYYRVIENGVETITVHEDGVLKSKTVNGTPQLEDNQAKQRIKYVQFYIFIVLLVLPIACIMSTETSNL